MTNLEKLMQNIDDIVSMAQDWGCAQKSCEDCAFNQKLENGGTMCMATGTAEEIKAWFTSEVQEKLK